jgi:hypothetical protein
VRMPTFRIRTLMIVIAGTGFVLAGGGLLGLSITDADTWTVPAWWLYLGLAVDISLVFFLVHIWLASASTPRTPDDRAKRSAVSPSVRLPRLIRRRWLATMAMTGGLPSILLLGLRATEYRSRAVSHTRHLMSARSFLYESENLRRWHRRMQLKYDRAARHPWIPLPPDSPPPE